MVSFSFLPSVFQDLDCLHLAICQSRCCSHSLGFTKFFLFMAPHSEGERERDALYQMLSGRARSIGLHMCLQGHRPTASCLHASCVCVCFENLAAPACSPASAASLDFKRFRRIEKGKSSGVTGFVGQPLVCDEHFQMRSVHLNNKLSQHSLV